MYERLTHKKILTKIISIIIAVCFLATSVPAYALRPALLANNLCAAKRAGLRPQAFGNTGSKQEPDVTLAAGAGNIVSPHETGVNVYIAEHLPFAEELQASLVEERKERPEKLIRDEKLRIIGYAGERSIVAIPVPGLLDNHDQFGHIGLGRSYEDYIIAWVDEKYLNNDTVRAHEIYEIIKWENLRRALIITERALSNYYEYLENEVRESRLSRQEANRLYIRANAAKNSSFLPEMMRFFIRYYYERPVEQDIVLYDSEVIKAGTTSLQIAEKWHNEAPPLDELLTAHKTEKQRKKAERAITLILTALPKGFPEIGKLIQDAAEDFPNPPQHVDWETIWNSTIGIKAIIHRKTDAAMWVSYSEERIELHALLDFMEFLNNDDELKLAVAHEIAHRIVALYFSRGDFLNLFYKYMRLLQGTEKVDNPDEMIRRLEAFFNMPGIKEKIERELCNREWLSDAIGAILAESAGADVVKATDTFRRFKEFESPNLLTPEAVSRVAIRTHPGAESRTQGVILMSDTYQKGKSSLEQLCQMAASLGAEQYIAQEKDINLGAEAQQALSAATVAPDVGKKGMAKKAASDKPGAEPVPADMTRRDFLKAVGKSAVIPIALASLPPGLAGCPPPGIALDPEGEFASATRNITTREEWIDFIQSQFGITIKDSEAPLNLEELRLMAQTLYRLPEHFRKYTKAIKTVEASEDLMVGFGVVERDQNNTVTLVLPPRNEETAKDIRCAFGGFQIAAIVDGITKSLTHNKKAVDKSTLESLLRPAIYKIIKQISDNAGILDKSALQSLLQATIDEIIRQPSYSKERMDKFDLASPLWLAIEGLLMSLPVFFGSVMVHEMTHVFCFNADSEDFPLLYAIFSMS